VLRRGYPGKEKYKVTPLNACPGGDKRKVTSLNDYPGGDKRKVTSLNAYPGGDKYKVTVIYEYPRKIKRIYLSLYCNFIGFTKYSSVGFQHVRK
jgi:hypothetical protein